MKNQSTAVHGSGRKIFYHINVQKLCVVLNKEVSVYGLTLAGSGISQIVASQFTETLPAILPEYVGTVFLLIGALIFLVGFLWKPEPSGRPLGITLLAVSYAVVGFLVVLLGGWFFTPLFLLGFVCFVLSYGLLAKKTWALFGVLLFLVIGFLASLVGIGNEGIVNVAGVLNSCYLIWYINREHVTEYFNTGLMMPRLSRRSLTTALVVVLLFLLPIWYFYYNPPSIVLASSVSGSPGPGGSQYTFSKGDSVNCTFQVVPGYSPVTVTIQSGEEYDSGNTIASATGTSGSAVGTAPSTGKYTVWVGTSSGYYSVDYKIIVTEYSLRRMTPQWVLLDVYAAIAVLYAILAAKATTPIERKPVIEQQPQNIVDSSNNAPLLYVYRTRGLSTSI
jgi:hypothetical protein